MTMTISPHSCSCYLCPSCYLPSRNFIQFIAAINSFQFVSPHLCLSLVIFSLPSCVSSDQGINLKQEPELQQKVTLNYVPITFADLLQILSGSQLQLRCGGSIAFQKLQMHLVDQPIYSVMNSLDKLIPGSWEKALRQTATFLHRAHLMISQEFTLCISEYGMKA